MQAIKRYKNRKLYSTNESRYVTLQDLVFLSTTEPFKVTDVSTGDDITNETMLNAFVNILDRDSKVELLGFAKKLFEKRSKEQNLKTLTKEDSNDEY